MDELTLSNETVLRTRVVPPYAMRAMYKKHPEPDFPYVPVTSAAGGTEKLPALQETPEWNEYQKAMRQHRDKIRQVAVGFQLNFGIMSWKLKGKEDFETIPPDDWEVDPILRGYGEVMSDDPMERRSQYIQFELVPTSDDADMISIAIGVTEESDNSPVTKEDVLAAAAPFELGTP